MLQRSKLICSRDEWKHKAVQRAGEIREHRKTQRRYQQRIAQLKAQICALEQAGEVKKNELEPAAAGNPVELAEARQVRTLCVRLVLQAVVSFRSVPRILDLLRTQALLCLKWVPHFTSVINWTLRVGLGLLRQVAPISQPWVAIIDHCIDVGTNKALVVLRVPLEALSQRGAAIQLGDCECIGLRIAETVNGETIALHLAEIFARSGTPLAIIKDCEATLQKGLRLWMGQSARRRGGDRGYRPCHGRRAQGAVREHEQ
jgi:transposase InsO family protein